jgi:hypothetical protein
MGNWTGGVIELLHLLSAGLIATIAGSFSTSAHAGDMVVRSINRLLLQSWASASAIIIDTANVVTIPTTSLAIGNTTAYSYKLYVNGVSYFDGNLKCPGIGNIHNNSPYAVPNNHMAAGSLTFGSTSANYGAATNWSLSTASLMNECADYTVICVHDSGTRVASLMYCDGPSNQIYIGRDKYWGSTNTTIVCYGK